MNSRNQKGFNKTTGKGIKQKGEAVEAETEMTK